MNSPEWKETAELYGESKADRMLDKVLNEAKKRHQKKMVIWTR